MSQNEIVEKASDKVADNKATGAAFSADPVATGNAHANRKADKLGQTEGGIPAPAGDIEDANSLNNTKPTGDNSGKNKSSIATKASAASASMKEEIDGLFGDDLSEEFKLKATTIFEAAVSGRIAEERAALEEEYAAKKEELEESYQAQAEQIKEELSAQVNDYLDYVVEQWMEENQVAIDSSLNTQIAQEFIEKLKGLFEDSYMQVPEDKLDVVEELAAKLEEMEQQLNGVVAENIELRSVVEAKSQAEIFDEVSEGLAMTQVEKFRTLAEGVTYDSAETYRKKLEIVKEQFISEKKVVTTKTIEEQEMVELDEETVAPQKAAPTGPVSSYVSAISRTIKK